MTTKFTYAIQPSYLAELGVSSSAFVEARRQVDQLYPDAAAAAQLLCLHPDGHSTLSARTQA